MSSVETTRPFGVVALFDEKCDLTDERQGSMSQCESWNNHRYVNSFQEETVSSDSSERPIVETNTENVPEGCETSSCHESTSFNVGNETLRDRGNALYTMKIQVMSKQC